MVVEYMDRAQGPTLGFLAQNLHTTQSNPAKSTLLRTRPDCGSHSDLPPIFAHSLADASVGQGEVVATILVTDQGHNRGEEAIGLMALAQPACSRYNLAVWCEPTPSVACTSRSDASPSVSSINALILDFLEGL